MKSAKRQALLVDLSDKVSSLKFSVNCRECDANNVVVLLINIFKDFGIQTLVAEI